MPWIHTVPKEEAGEELLSLFDRLKIQHGRMFTPFEPMTNNPKALLAVVALNDAIRFGPSDLKGRGRARTAPASRDVRAPGAVARTSQRTGDGRSSR